MEGKKYFKMVLSGAIGVFVLLLILTNCYTVDTGEVVIISTFGKITRVENEGLHFKIPFVQSKTFMETREKTYIFGKTDEMDTTMDDFSQYGMSVSNVSIVNHDFSDEYERAIESKKVAEQEVEKARAEQEKLKVEAENKVRLAEYSLQEKELQAKANAVESNSLTPQLLRKMAIEKWDGKLPQVQGNNGSTLINLD